mgnify:CR=1 FL=1
MIRWLKKKEGDLEMRDAANCRIDSAQEQLTAYQVRKRTYYSKLLRVTSSDVRPKFQSFDLYIESILIDCGSILSLSLLSELYLLST